MHFLFPSLLVFFLVDRLTKTFFFFQEGGERIALFPVVLEFRRIWNSNVLFFFSFSQQQQVLFFIFLIFLFSAWVIVTFSNKKFHGRDKLIFFQCLIIIGALSNIIDRALYGAVLDWIIFVPFSALNIADIYILTGICGSAFISFAKQR